MHPINSPSDGLLPPAALRAISHSVLAGVQQHISPIVNAAHALALNVDHLTHLVETRPPTALKRELDGTLRLVDANALAASLRAARYALRNLEEQFQSLNTEVQHLVRYQDEIHDESVLLVPMVIRANWYARQVNRTVARAQNLGTQQVHVARHALDTVDSTRRFYHAPVRGIDRSLLTNLETLSTL